MDALLTEDTPQADRNASETRKESKIIGGLVASQSVVTLAVTVCADNRVVVVDGAINEVKDVPAEHRRQGHDAPILGKTANAESVCGQRREDAE